MQNTIQSLSSFSPSSEPEPVVKSVISVLPAREEPSPAIATILRQKKSVRGVITAFTIIGIWTVSLLYLFNLDLNEVGILQRGVAIAIQTFLYTGLFITAHDAMHRSLCPDYPRFNDFIGRLCVFLYAFFPYQKLLKNHQLHHLHPATQLDPDFYHNGQSNSPLLWYLSFIGRYYSWEQFITTSIAYSICAYCLHIPKENLIMLWVLPSLLSSVQLFIFGTFLPHCEPEGGYSNAHHSYSNSLPTLLSFLTCYHFGYHEEHHEYPSTPWWQLPAIRKLRQTSQVVPTESPAQ